MDELDEKVLELNFAADPDARIGVRDSVLGGKARYELFVMPEKVGGESPVTLIINEGQLRVLAAWIGVALRDREQKMREQLSPDAMNNIREAIYGDYR